jgi:hypothetical protein
VTVVIRKVLDADWLASLPDATSEAILDAFLAYYQADPIDALDGSTWEIERTDAPCA